MPGRDPQRLLEIPDVPLVAERSARENRAFSLEERWQGVASPTRSELARRRAAALMAAVASAGALLASLGVRADLDRLSPAYLVSWLALPFALGFVALGLALVPTRTGLGIRVAVACAVAAAAPIALGVIALALAPPSGAANETALAKNIALCLALTLVGAATPFALALVALRNAFAAGAAWRSALVGGASGLLAGGSMNLHCAIAQPLHLILGHALPVALAICAGACLGYRWLRA